MIVQCFMSTVDIVDQQFVSGILSRWCLSKIVLHVTELYSCDHYQTPGEHEYQSASGASGSTAATVLQHHTDRLAAYRSGHAAFVDPTPLTRMYNDAASETKLFIIVKKKYFSISILLLYEN